MSKVRHLRFSHDWASVRAGAGGTWPPSETEDNVSASALESALSQLGLPGTDGQVPARRRSSALGKVYIGPHE